jgi:hypothetical protein
VVVPGRTRNSKNRDLKSASNSRQRPVANHATIVSSEGITCNA